LVPLYARLRVLSTAQEGDRFDYWVGNDERQWGLEVSGTIDEDLHTRHRAKIRQLLSNPFGVDGYVAVTKFSTRESLFSLHRYRRENKMTPSQNGSISRRGLPARFIQDEKETSRLILESNLLKSQQRRKELLDGFELNSLLRQRITEYLDVLKTRVDQWMTYYAPDVAAVAD